MLKDVEDGSLGKKQMNYQELVDEVNKDMKRLEYVDKPL